MKSATVSKELLDVSWMNMALSRHAWHKARQRHITMAVMLEAFDAPDKSRSNHGYGKLLRVSGKNVVLIGEPVGSDFEVVTVFARHTRWTATERATHEAQELRSREISAKCAAASAAVFAACHH